MFHECPSSKMRRRIWSVKNQSDYDFNSVRKESVRLILVVSQVGGFRAIGAVNVQKM